MSGASVTEMLRLSLRIQHGMLCCSGVQFLRWRMLCSSAWDELSYVVTQICHCLRDLRVPGETHHNRGVHAVVCSISSTIATTCGRRHTMRCGILRMCDMSDSGHIRGNLQDHIGPIVPCNGAPRLRAELGMRACQPLWQSIRVRLDATLPSTAVDLFHMSEVVSSVKQHLLGKM